MRISFLGLELLLLILGVPARDDRAGESVRDGGWEGVVLSPIVLKG
jgi:hypothetical protein